MEEFETHHWGKQRFVGNLSSTKPQRLQSTPVRPFVVRACGEYRVSTLFRLGLLNFYHELQELIRVVLLDE